MSLLNWLRNGSSVIPSAINAAAQGRIPNMEPAASLPDSQSFSVDDENPTAPFVVRLNGTRSPIAVLRRVWSVVVSAFDGELRSWPRSHVSVESREIVAPAVAHRNATAAVVRKISSASYVASLFSFAPYSMFCGLTEPVLPVAAASAARLKAPAPYLLVFAQQVMSHVDSGSAITTARPPRVLVFRQRDGNHREASDTLASEIDCGPWHDLAIIPR